MMAPPYNHGVITISPVEATSDIAVFPLPSEDTSAEVIGLKPGFPEIWGRQSIILVNFPQKLHENEKIWTQVGRARPWHPLGSANDTQGGG